MKNHQSLNVITTGIVVLIHIGVIMLAWQSTSNDDPIAMDNLTLIDLGSLQGNDQPVADGAPAPLEGQAKPEPEVPKPIPEKIKPIKSEPVVKQNISKVKAVVRNDKPADMANIEQKPVVQNKLPSPNKPSKLDVKTMVDEKIEPTNSSDKVSLAAVNRSKDGITGGGQGNNPNSKVPSNPASSNQNGDGKGKKGESEKPSNHSGVDYNQIVDGGALHLPIPPYPARAREEDEEGTVKIVIVVEPNGVISDAKISKSSGSRILDNAGLNAVRKAKIRPKQINGIPVRSRFIVPYDFRLS